MESAALHILSRICGLLLSSALDAETQSLGAQRWWDGGEALPRDDTYIYLVGVLLLFFAGAVFMGARLLLAKRSHAKQLHREFSQMRSMLSENQQRIDLIETHALDYLNSMSGRATRAFGVAKQIVLAINQVLREGEELLERGDYAALIEAEELLESRLVLKKAHLNAVQDGYELPDLYRDQWGPTLDKLFQEVGNEISRASNAAREFNFSKRDSKRTYEDLRRAGIHFLKEQGRRLTATFRSPFNKQAGDSSKDQQL